jgi:hypothetical protein
MRSDTFASAEEFQVDLFLRVYSANGITRLSVKGLAKQLKGQTSGNHSSGTMAFLYHKHL